MRDQARTEEDRQLEDCLLEAAAREFAEELRDRTPVQTSPAFQKEMERMLKDPNKWAAGRKRRPAWKRILRTAAMVALVCTVAGGSLMAVSPDFRAAVARVTDRIALSWQGEHKVRYDYQGQSTDDELPYPEVTLLARDYQETFRNVSKAMSFVAYAQKGSEEPSVILLMIRVQEASAMTVFGEGMTLQEVEVWGLPAQLYHDDRGKSTIVWHNEEQTLQFCMEGTVSDRQLVRMAESVVLRENSGS